MSSQEDLDGKEVLHTSHHDANMIEIDKATGQQVVVADHGEVVTTIDPKAERRLVWKFDLRILPVLAVMYLFNSLDKSNLGNAKTAHLETDLGLGKQ
jgi:hypothetical protein